ncbi:hypothetical protein SAMN05660923_01830 [Tepidimicrobium xylanilyticum]|uniref:Uncharacterized protein n=2 Tax=Tepidimicrobium xylanilyticum TaxID=1123352 RepID=A0A1H2ZGJ0_9FIRM|nr:hypothetical protein SAMN05660923_01830 [Tepidimicrobium xylanilyticum]
MMNSKNNKDIKSIKRKLDRLLTDEEKVLYKKVLEDIAKNEDFYNTSSPEEITAHLVNNCGFDKISIYKLFKKITLISEE